MSIAVFGPFNAHGQLNHGIRDSLEQVLARTSDAIGRTHLLGELAWSHLFSDKALPYLHELDSLSQVLADHPDPEVRAKAASSRSRVHYQRGYLAKFHRNLIAAQHDFREAERIAWLARDTLAAANAMNALGICFMALDMPEQALVLYEDELELILSTAEKSDMYMAHIRQHKADALMHLGRLDEAQNELMLCDTMEAGRHALTLMGLGHLEAYRGDTGAALAHMAKAESIAQRSPEKWNLITVLEPMAALQLKAGRTSDALATAKKAIALSRVLGDDAALAGGLVIAGEATLKNGDVRGAELHFLEAMAIAERNGFIGLSRETGDDGSMIRAAEKLKDLYKTQGRIAEALAMTERWAEWTDSIHRIEGREELLRFDLQQAQLTDSIADARRVEEATQDLKSSLEHERATRKLTLIVVTAIASIILLIGLLMWNVWKKDRTIARHEQQRGQQERMIRDLRMRDTMSEDLHQELGAGLSALKLWSEMDLDEETDPRRRKLLADRITMANELIASLRQIIWAMNSNTVTVKQLVDFLVDHAHTYCALHGLRLHTQLAERWPTVMLHPDQRRNPFLAVKECLINTMKHSGADRVDLCMNWDNALVIDIHDNGVGSETPADQLPGNGLRTMKRRIADIGGQVHVDGSEGMRVRIRLPLDTGQGN